MTNTNLAFYDSLTLGIQQLEDAHAVLASIASLLEKSADPTAEVTKAVALARVGRDRAAEWIPLLRRDKATIHTALQQQ